LIVVTFHKALLFIICFVGNWAFKAWFLQMLWR
jgi:nitrate reductase NapE component